MGRLTRVKVVLHGSFFFGLTQAKPHLIIINGAIMMINNLQGFNARFVGALHSQTGRSWIAVIIVAGLLLTGSFVAFRIVPWRNMSAIPYYKKEYDIRIIPVAAYPRTDQVFMSTPQLSMKGGGHDKDGTPRAAYLVKIDAAHGPHIVVEMEANDSRFIYACAPTADSTIAEGESYLMEDRGTLNLWQLRKYQLKRAQIPGLVSMVQLTIHQSAVPNTVIVSCDATVKSQHTLDGSGMSIQSGVQPVRDISRRYSIGKTYVIAASPGKERNTKWEPATLLLMRLSAPR
jgi:hypothetical protein